LKISKWVSEDVNRRQTTQWPKEKGQINDLQNTTEKIKG